MVFTNGDTYEGQFNNDLIDGPGTFTKQNGEQIKGVWSQNQMVEME
jgi:hypothetical protein